MAKKRPCSHTTIRGTDKIVKAGDCVLMRPSGMRKLPRVAHVEKIEQDNRNNVSVRVRWYYRPEESFGGRRQFHGAKELFLSDQYDVQSAHNIVGKCVVHSCKDDTIMFENLGTDDYYCRFEYKAASGTFTPDFVAVYCKCQMPKNPDDFMVDCKGCLNWFHPACVGMSIEEAKNMMGYFLCSVCLSVIDSQNPEVIYPSPEYLPSDDQQVIRRDSFHESIHQRLTKVEKTIRECTTLLEALNRRLARHL